MKDITDDIRSKIHNIRGMQVMLDKDLTELYGVSTGNLNKAVRRNIQRFPENFMFQLTRDEYNSLRFHFGILDSNSSGSQPVTLQSGRGKYSKFLPYAFSEQGVAMLSGVLKSDTAVRISIQIIETFIAMRRFIASNAQVFQEVSDIKTKLIDHDQKFEKVFDIIEEKHIKPQKGIFFDGQVFDAYRFVSDMIRGADKSIIIIDNKEVYHFGASLKDLGRKWFGFSKFGKEALSLLQRLPP